MMDNRPAIAGEHSFFARIGFERLPTSARLNRLSRVMYRASAGGSVSRYDVQNFFCPTIVESFRDCPPESVPNLHIEGPCPPFGTHARELTGKKFPHSGDHPMAPTIQILSPPEQPVFSKRAPPGTTSRIGCFLPGTTPPVCVAVPGAFSGRARPRPFIPIAHF